MPSDELDDPRSLQRKVVLPGGYEILRPGPIVIVGPNGSGKSRRARELASDVNIEVINALRNTKISQQLQAMALQQAKQNYLSQRDQARSQPYELANDFDYMLTALVSEAGEIAIEYLRQARAGEVLTLPKPTTLEQIQELWSKFFPGRELRFSEYLPIVLNTVLSEGVPKQYSAWQMSDGEKAGLYLAGRALGSEHRAVLLVDEPETHFHSLLAIDFWNAIEAARPDLRIIYSTHDMMFATSRRDSSYLLASPKDGLRLVTLDAAPEIAALLLGTASLSFYAKRVIFCEGQESSLDKRLYTAWFNNETTIVRPVGSCDSVLQCVSALKTSNLISNLEVIGIVDRDFNSDELLTSLTAEAVPLKVHEVETLFALPDVVSAVAKHHGQSLDKVAYEQSLVASYSDKDRHKVILERWKRRVEARLVGVTASVSAKNESLDSIAAEIPHIFDHQSWDFQPQQLLKDEKDRVESALRSSSAFDLAEVLGLMPGKQLLPVASQRVGFNVLKYTDLIINALRGENPRLADLGQEIRGALEPYLPSAG